MKEVYGYIRVSTERQGVKGVSLGEQKEAIERYSKQNNLLITQWFEERVTAAKLGRPTFTKMISSLRSGLALGVIIHKIDRSARNLRDWADLVDLADQGVEIHFVNESIDMGIRGGRLSADIQAVVAADYIRNLREETIKGLRGRLKQGLYPWGAPIGYLNKGGGNVKEIDPIKGPLVRDLFNKYATGEYTLKSLLKDAQKNGLSNRYNKPLSMSGLSSLLHNPFYAGIIYVKRMNETFTGKHAPIIDQEKFDKVQQVLEGKTTKGNGKHHHPFRRTFICASCSRSLIGEIQKGRVYYRCHNCKGVSVREDAIEDSIAQILAPFRLCEHEADDIEAAREKMCKNNKDALAIEKDSLNLECQAIDTRLGVLIDALLDETIDKETYLLKKDLLIRKKQAVEGKLAAIARGVSKNQLVIDKYLELYKTAYLSYSKGNSIKRRELLDKLTSNRFVSGKKVIIDLQSPFQELCEIKKIESCAHCRDWSRTFDEKSTKHRKTFRKKLDEWIKQSLSEEGSQSP